MKTPPRLETEEFDKGFREGVQYAMDYLRDVYGLEDIEETFIWEEYGDNDE